MAIVGCILNYITMLQVIKDYHLIAKVGALLAIDGIILVPWTIFHPQHVTAISKLDKVAFDMSKQTTRFSNVINYFQSYTYSLNYTTSV